MVFEEVLCCVCLTMAISVLVAGPGLHTMPLSQVNNLVVSCLQPAICYICVRITLLAKQVILVSARYHVNVNESINELSGKSVKDHSLVNTVGLTSLTGRSSF